MNQLIYKNFGGLMRAAEMMDMAGFYTDADLVDGFLKQALSESDMKKVAGMWADFVSRLGGWARQLLFREYRELFRKAVDAQKILTNEIAEHRAILEEWAAKEKELRKILGRHDLQDWRSGMASILSEMGISPERVIQPYDDQHGKMMAQVLKIAPQKLPQKETPETPATAPSIQPPKPSEEEKVSPVTKEEEVPTKEAPTKEAPTKEAPTKEAPTEEVVKEKVLPTEGWREEKFGRSRKHGWEWQWQVSEDNNYIRLPKEQLAAASSGQGKILHRSENLYRPTYGTASMKLKGIMGDTYWKAVDDPQNPNMAILTRTEKAVEPPLGMRPTPIGQAEKLRKLRNESANRFSQIIVAACEGKNDEERIAYVASNIIDEV